MTTQDRIDRVKKLYAQLGLHNLDTLNEIYTDDVTFVDPVNRIQGRESLIAHFRDSYRDVLSCRFSFDSAREMIIDDRALLVWTMDLQHRRLAAGKPIKVKGSSYLEMSNRGIHYHRDWFDLGEMVYEQVPVLGGLVRAVKSRLRAKH